MSAFNYCETVDNVLSTPYSNTKWNYNADQN